MHLKLSLVSLAVLLVLLVGVQASNILFFHSAGTKSHRISIWPLAEKLADKGHNVTYIFPLHMPKGSHPRIEEITPSKMVPVLERNIKDYDINFRLNDSNHLLMQTSFDMCFELCEAFYESPNIQEWIHRPNLHFDLVLIDSSMGECIYGLVHKLKAKHIIFVPGFIPYHWDGFGVTPESASIPPSIVYSGRPAKPTGMDFFGRFWSTVEPLMWRYGYTEYLGKVRNLIMERMNISSFPPLDEFQRNTSLVFSNTHFVEDYPMSLPPMFQSYSGLWCSKDKIKERKPLPEVMAKFVEGNDSDGFIYISFGSAIKSASMPLEKRKVFFDAINAFPKLRFLWRWTGPIPEDKPKNLLLEKWFPQNDILAHPKIKGFVTQCGRPSSQEAICHAVPLITIPVFADQDYNADRLEYIGGAINLDILTMTAEDFQNSIEELAYKESYKKRMTQLSTMFKDRPLDPLENTLYWTEYVLRHDTSLLKPLGLQQTWYQRRLLDVYLFLAGSILVVISITIASIFVAFKLILRVVGTESVRVKRKSD